jgi:hypothetical protein
MKAGALCPLSKGAVRYRLLLMAPGSFQSANVMTPSGLISRSGAWRYAVR